MTPLSNEQKLWLANRLLEQIKHVNRSRNGFRYDDLPPNGFEWTVINKDIKDTEWHYIVSLVEGQLNSETYRNYRLEVWRQSELSELDEDKKCRTFLSATPSQRTTALMQVLKDEK